MDKPSDEVLVERWLRKRDADAVEDPPFDLDSDGFLADPHQSASMFGFATNDELLRPEIAAAGGAVLLLGEPGLGKTTTFEQLAPPSSDEPQPGKPGVVWITGPELADHDDLERSVGRFLAAWSPVATPPGEAQPKLTVVIDQLDESSLLARGLVRRLGKLLANTNTHDLRFLVACRTADCPPDLASMLENAFGSCIVADLAPLSRRDATNIATATGVDGEVCLAAIVAAGAGGLGSVPLILNLLIDTFRKNPEILEQGAQAVFEQGVTHLAEEWDRNRTVTNVAESTTDHRLVIAQRAAARLVLSGRRTIFLGKAGASSTDMTDSSLASGSENMAGGSFTVSATLVQETIHTSLFTSAGTDRLSFRHSSVAAFLAASYLIAIDTPRQQLEDLILVSAADESSARIPVSLRETAAWLAELSPLHAEWIVTADPEAIVAYSAYLTNRDTLFMLVNSLLRHAVQISRGPRSWQAARWRLDHPMLGEQLLPVLEQAMTDQVLTDDTAARVRLAVQLARDGNVTSLAQPLAVIAEQAPWQITLRQRAARTAHELDPTGTAERLRDLLKTLQPNHGQPDRDRDELAGTVILLLWPNQIPVEDVLPHLHRPASLNFHGTFIEALDFIVSRANETQLQILLEDIQIKTQEIPTKQPSGVTTPTNDADASEDANIDPPLIGSIPSSAVDKLIARSLLSASPDDHLDSVVKLLVPRLMRFERPAIPSAMDLEDIDGVEPEEKTQLRHRFIIALIRQILHSNAEFSRKDAFVICQNWSNREPIFGWSTEDSVPGCRRGGRQQILDNGDFKWGLAATDKLRSDGSDELADALGLTVCVAANLYDELSFELGYDRQGTPEWEHIKYMYTPIETASELANDLRRSVLQAPETAWTDGQKFRNEQLHRYKSVSEEDISEFTYLVLNLSVDPKTGKADQSDSDDLRTFIGMSILPPDSNTVLTSAAVSYLSTENDHRDLFLGQGKWGYHAAAGDLALALLYQTGQLSRVPSDCWKHWTGTLFTVTHGYAGRNEQRTKEVLRYFNKYAADELAQTIKLEVEGNLDRNAATVGINALSPMASIVAETIRNLASQIDAALHLELSDETAKLASFDTDHARNAARETWQALTELLIEADDTATNDLVRNKLSSDEDVALALRSAVILLEHDPASAWPLIQIKMNESPQFITALADALGNRRGTRAMLTDLDETALVYLYLIVAKSFPPDQDPLPSGLFTARDYARDLRDGALNTLVNMGTPLSVTGVRQIANSHPNADSLQTALIVARQRAQESVFPQLVPAQIAELLLDARLRSISSDEQLAQLLIHTLREIELSLDTHNNLLWDCERQSSRKDDGRNVTVNLWRPKPEEALSAYLSHELTLRIGDRGIVMNREVVIRPTDAKGAGGERVDINVQAIPQKTVHHPNGPSSTETLTVPIEIKGCWNREVPTSQTHQLAKRYLKPGEREVGIYLIGVFPLERWNAQDSRKAEAIKIGQLTDLQEKLDAEAENIAKTYSVHTHPILIKIDRAHKPGY